MSDDIKPKKMRKSPKRAFLRARRAKKRAESQDLQKSGGRKREEERGIVVDTRESIISNAKIPTTIDTILTTTEREILRLVNVERVDISEVADVLNVAQSTSAWNHERVCDVIERARAKLSRAGELELSRPDAYTNADMRARYDSIVRGLRDELKNLSARDNEARYLMLAGARATILKTIAQVERMRDDALGALTSKPGAGQGAGAFVYVSHLREGVTVAAAAVQAGKPIPPTPPGGD